MSDKPLFALMQAEAYVKDMLRSEGWDLVQVISTTRVRDGVFDITVQGMIGPCEAEKTIEATF